MLPSEAVLNFRIPSHVVQLSRIVREGVTKFGRAHDVPEDDLSHFLTALGEALANAIEHARAERPIEIAVRLRPDRILATVRDNGIGFRANVVVDSGLPDVSAERGRGFPIMRRCSDIFAIDSVPGKGTAVAFGRYLRPHGEAVARAASSSVVERRLAG